MKGNIDMRTGVITVNGGLNYGASLQAFALVQALRRNGADAYLLNYENNRIRRVRMSKKVRWVKPDSVQACKRDIIYLYHLLTGMRPKKKERLFDQFEMEIMDAALPRCDTIDGLKKMNRYYDCFVCGSDQIWNDEITEGDNAYFLSFADSDKVKAAYAPSFGKTMIYEQLDDLSRSQMKEMLSTFNCLSVREKVNQSFVKKLTEKACAVVLDPTLLLKNDDWKQVADETGFKTPSFRYAFIYQVIKDDELLQYAVEQAKKQGCKLISVSEGKRRASKHGFVSYRDKGVGPKEFIKLILNAEFVITSSFHGLAFSVLFHKQVWACPIRGAKKERSIRLTELLGMLDMKKIYIDSLNKDLQFEPIDWKRVDQKLAEERRFSLDYLHSIIYSRI